MTLRNGRWSQSVVHGYRDAVEASPKVQMLPNVQLEGEMAAFVAAHVGAVDEDVGCVVHGAEADGDAFAWTPRLRREELSFIPCPTNKIA